MLHREPERRQRGREPERERESERERTSQRARESGRVSQRERTTESQRGPQRFSLALSDWESARERESQREQQRARDSHIYSLWHSQALSGLLSGSLWLSLARSPTLSGPLWLSNALRICLQCPCLAQKALAQLVAVFLRYMTFFRSVPCHGPWYHHMGIYVYVYNVYNACEIECQCEPLWGGSWWEEEAATRLRRGRGHSGEGGGEGAGGKTRSWWSQK